MIDIVSNLLGETIETGFRKNGKSDIYYVGIVRGVYVDRGLVVVFEITEVAEAVKFRGEQPGDIAWTFIDSDHFIRVRKAP